MYLKSKKPTKMAPILKNGIYLREYFIIAVHFDGHILDMVNKSKELF